MREGRLKAKGVYVNRAFMGLVEELANCVEHVDRNGFANMPQEVWVKIAHLTYDLRESMPCDRKDDRRFADRRYR